MTAETLSYPNGVVANGDLISNPNPKSTKKTRESERRRRRRKQKKNNKASQATDSTTGDDSDDADDDAKENANPQQFVEQVEVEYVPEKAELYGILDDEFRKVFEKFTFHETAGLEEADKKDESAANAASKKKDSDSDSEEEEQDAQQKERGLSNKKKKLQRRMKIAELKQICSRPDVVEILHDAFFKYQTKPKLTTHGDLYHEGKEFELICLEARNQIKWMSPYNQKSWKFWIMFWLPKSRRKGKERKGK